MTNIQGKQFLYIFLIIIAFLINVCIYRNNLLRLSVVIVIGLSLGYAISMYNQYLIDSKYQIILNQTSNFRNKVKIEGQILDNYRQGDISNIYVIKILKINDHSIYQKISILGTINNKVNIREGDIINFDSKLFKIINFNGFQYDKYLLLNDIVAQTNIYQIAKKGNNNTYYNNFILSFRNNIKNTIEEIFPGDTAKLLNGILLGQKGNYSKELKNDFNNSGLSHIIAVSGYNITIIIIFLNVFLRFLPKKIKILTISFFLIFFIALIGDNLPAVRAGLMGILGYSAILYGRKINIYSVLLIIIAILAIFNPLILNYDIGFQLSILALIGLITLSNRISDLLGFITNRLQIRDSLSSTISVTIFTLPIILINFGKISIISIITNLLVLPVVSLSMLTGTISVLFYYINQSIGILTGYIAYAFLKYILIIVSSFGKISIATISLNLGEFGVIFFMVYYFLIIYIVSSLSLIKKINTN